MRDTHKTLCLSTGTGGLQVVGCDLELSQLDAEEGSDPNVIRGLDEIQRLRFRGVGARDAESASTYVRPNRHHGL
jgi:hypothetical protein